MREWVEERFIMGGLCKFSLHFFSGVGVSTGSHFTGAQSFKGHQLEEDL